VINLRTLKDTLAIRLVAIEDLLSPDYQITLVARHRSNPRAHILVSVDSIDEVRRALTELEAPDTKEVR
jgi:hypothetical protein